MLFFLTGGNNENGDGSEIASQTVDKRALNEFVPAGMTGMTNCFHHIRAAESKAAT